jgi:hypothetical protein
MKKLAIFGVHHERNIRVEGKNVHIVVFIFVQKAVVERGVGGRCNTNIPLPPLPTYFLADPWIFNFKRRLNRQSPHQRFLHEDTERELTRLKINEKSSKNIGV